VAKPGFLQALTPILGLGAAALAPELLPALGGIEAGAGAAEAAPFLIPGTDAAIEGASIPLGELGAPFLLPGTDTPLVGGASTAFEGGQIPFSLADTAGATGALGLGGAVPGLGGAAPAELGGGPGGLLTAEAPAATPGADVAPLAQATRVTGPLDASIPAMAPASPISPAATAAPAGSPLPDLTAAAGAATTSGDFPGELSAATPTVTGAGGGAVAGGGDFPGELSPGAGGGLLAGLGDYAGKTGNYLLEHPGLPLTAGIAGMQLLKGNPQYPAAQTIAGYANPAGAAGGAATAAGFAGLEGTAATTAGEAASLTAPLTTGVLPPGLKQTVDATTQAQKAAVRSQYAKYGLTDSTMETDKLAQVDANSAAQTAGIAEGLLQPAQGFSGQSLNALSNLTSSGANLTGMSLNAYNALLSAQMKNDQNYQTALYNFARALSGSGYAAPTTSV
jgi:hypothetical protein